MWYKAPRTHVYWSWLSLPLTLVGFVSIFASCVIFLRGCVCVHSCQISVMTSAAQLRVMSSNDEESIKRLQRYIQIPTISKETDYVECVNFLKSQAEEIGIECKVLQLKPNRPVVVMKWPGMKPDLPAICLNSHMDVVPVETDKWTHPPFSGHMDDQGRIYGRGTHDMKCVGMQYLEAVRRLKRDDAVLARTLIITFVPDEERGGQEGMKLFVKTKYFRQLNIGFGLDEGCGSGRPQYFLLFYGEKHKWSVKFHVTGDVGHACYNQPNTAGAKLARLLKIIYDFRDEQYQLANQNPVDPDVVSINATIIEGGTEDNVIPSEFVVTCDIRLPSNTKEEEWRATIKAWCEDAGEGVWVEEVVCEIVDKPTLLDESNPYYQPIVETLRKMGHEVIPMICPAVTDARFMRNLNIPVFGFSPIASEPLLHGHDEFIGKKEYLLGITMYYRILLQIGYIPELN